MTTFYLLIGVSFALLVTAYLLNPPRLMHGVSAGRKFAKPAKSNGGRVKSFRETIALIANLVGILAGILAIIQYFAGQS